MGAMQTGQCDPRCLIHQAHVKLNCVLLSHPSVPQFFPSVLQFPFEASTSFLHPMAWPLWHWCMKVVPSTRNVHLKYDHIVTMVMTKSALNHYKDTHADVSILIEIRWHTVAMNEISKRNTGWNRWILMLQKSLWHSQRQIHKNISQKINALERYLQWDYTISKHKWREKDYIQLFS